MAEVAARAEFAGFDVVANVQGDEPFVSREALAGAIDRIGQGRRHRHGRSARSPPELAADPARVKVVTDARGRALYFSRAAIPHRREATDPADDCTGSTWVSTRTRARRSTAGSATPPSPAEQAERLEQLRALHCGLTIGVARLTEPALPGVDTPDDLRRAEAHWHALQG